MNEVTAGKLAKDLKTLRNDLGSLVKSTGATIGQLRRPIEAKIAAERKALAERRATRLSQPESSNKPASARAFDVAWIAVAIATGVGVTLGLLLRRHN